MKYDYYFSGRDKPYQFVKKCIIAEELLEDKNTHDIRDYKFFCFNGEVRSLFIASERQNREEPYFDFFTSDFRHIDVRQGHPNAPVQPPAPICFEEMKEISAKLSKGIPQVRIDLYEVNGKVYFGEMTFYHFGGMVPFEPRSVDEERGRWIDIK